MIARLPVVHDRVDLAALRAQPPGAQRRAAVVQRMRELTQAGATQALDALRHALGVAGAADATVAVRELLWADSAAVVDIAVAPDRVDVIRSVLGMVGGLELAAEHLPGGHGDATHRAVEPDSRWSVRAPSDTASPQWFAGELGFTSAAMSGLDGQGVTVAVVDSGVDSTHADLHDALRRGGVFDQFGQSIASGHGTFVAGIVAGAQTGLAPAVTLRSSRTYGSEFADHRGFDPIARRTQRINAIRALQDAIAPADGSAGADIAVTSWGILDAPGVPARDYDQAMATAAAAGMVVVAAAGNDGAAADGSGTISVPAQLADVLSVGGVDRQLRWHPSASVGPSPRRSDGAPDLAAPVVDIRSTRLGGGIADTTGQPNGGFAGTSAAAPIVAAALALLAQAVRDTGFAAAPDLDEVRSALPMLVRDVDAPGIDMRTGHGVIDVRAIRAAAEQIAAGRERIRP